VQEEQNGMPLTIAQQVQLKSQLKTNFLSDPKTVIEGLDLMAQLIDAEMKLADMEAEAGKQYTPTNSQGSVHQATPQPSYSGTGNLAQGHQIIRQTLGNDIGQMDFNSPKANQFRQFMYNTVLKSSSSHYDGGAGGYSSTTILFCPNGTYVQNLSGGVSISVPGMDASSSSEDDITPGYWDVATVNEIPLVLFYSTHPNMLEDSPNGFVPMPVAQYSDQIIYLPGGEYYHRVPNQPCQ